MMVQCTLKEISWKIRKSPLSTRKIRLQDKSEEPDRDGDSHNRSGKRKRRSRDRISHHNQHDRDGERDSHWDRLRDNHGSGYKSRYTKASVCPNGGRR